jgi:curved DNA-binding protein CbpA
MHRPGERRGMPEREIGDPFTILDVPRDADDATVAAAYRTLARRFHPDLAGDFGTQHMIRINAAYALIRDAAARASFSQRTGDRSFPRSRRPQSDGTGGAGPAPGRPSGTVLDFGRHIGWSIGEIARIDPGYLVWLESRREGRPYRDEIDETLRRFRHRSGDMAPPSMQPTYGAYRRG